MRRFYLYKRNEIYYCQLINPITKSILPAKSTGKRNLDDAEHVAMTWLVNGIPQGPSHALRVPEEVFSVDKTFEQLKALELTIDDARRIMDLLRRRGLIDVSTIKEEGPELIPWLMSFWIFEKSPYVAEKKAFGQSPN